ncbi:hypothetical protein V5799_031219 [Amblyomma americanum]|uniref:Uncharacterized protein n=1 Tax=Amblyomma americanum TaxID=6943 RepID=A0AAQ4EL09_AMBAM
MHSAAAPITININDGNFIYNVNTLKASANRQPDESDDQAEGDRTSCQEHHRRSFGLHSQVPQTMFSAAAPVTININSGNFDYNANPPCISMVRQPDSSVDQAEGDDHHRRNFGPRIQGGAALARISFNSQRKLRRDLGLEQQC